ncbi:MAG: hypothetical protein IPJ79_19675 [Bacteroidetes bacterium]|nr:hypothetical protein [Bacteroidota bacterium]
MGYGKTILPHRQMKLPHRQTILPHIEIIPAYIFVVKMCGGTAPVCTEIILPHAGTNASVHIKLLPLTPKGDQAMKQQ